MVSRMVIAVCNELVLSDPSCLECTSPTLALPELKRHKFFSSCLQPLSPSISTAVLRPTGAYTSSVTSFQDAPLPLCCPHNRDNPPQRRVRCTYRTSRYLKMHTRRNDIRNFSLGICCSRTLDLRADKRRAGDVAGSTKWQNYALQRWHER